MECLSENFLLYWAIIYLECSITFQFLLVSITSFWSWDLANSILHTVQKSLFTNTNVDVVLFCYYPFFFVQLCRRQPCSVFKEINLNKTCSSEHFELYTYKITEKRLNCINSRMTYLFASCSSMDENFWSNQSNANGSHCAIVSLSFWWELATPGLNLTAKARLAALIRPARI